MTQLAIPVVATAPPVQPRGRMLPAFALPSFQATPDFPQILTQTIFSPTRTGAAGVGGGANGALALVGIASTGRAASVIVRGPEGADHVLSLGETFSGWTLAGVTSEQARFMKGADTQVLTIGPASDSISPSSESANGQTGHLH